MKKLLAVLFALFLIVAVMPVSAEELLPAPTLLWPPDFYNTTPIYNTPDQTPSFDWSDVPGADSYRIVVNYKYCRRPLYNPKHPSPGCEIRNAIDEIVVASEYTPDHYLDTLIYTWYVTAIANGVEGLPSATWGLHIFDSGPGPRVGK